MKQPEAYINFEVYEDGVNFCGISSATLPDIAFMTQQLNGPGIAGNVDAVLTGMLEAMTLTLNFKNATDGAIKLASPQRHNLDLRVAEQFWDTQKVLKGISADKYIMVVIPKNTKPGNVAPASAADASGEYSVYYYAGYRDGKKLWELDPWNYICIINGVDYMKDVRKALGK